jgi:hypothetical protein
MKDLIIGGCSNYEWKDLRNWINSIRASGFDGDVALVGTNLSTATIEKLTSAGVIVKGYGRRDSTGVWTDRGPYSLAPHVERFFYLWEFLNNVENYYENVIVTDTRDVVFQLNPSDWLNDNLKDFEIVVSSEGLTYKNEPWGHRNLLDTFGPYFQKLLESKEIYNVGVIGGKHYQIASLLLMIFQMSLNRPVPVVDQAVFNFILNDTNYANKTHFTTNKDGWAIQLGTTPQVVNTGAGDIGKKFENISVTAEQYGYEDIVPHIDAKNGIVYKKDVGPAFCIVHQYDRFPALKQAIDKRYGDNDELPESRTTFHHPV